MGTRALPQNQARYSWLQDTHLLPCGCSVCIDNIHRAPVNANDGEWCPDPSLKLDPSSQGGASLNVYNIYILIKILFGLFRVSKTVLVSL